MLGVLCMGDSFWQYACRLNNNNLLTIRDNRLFAYEPLLSSYCQLLSLHPCN